MGVAMLPLYCVVHGMLQFGVPSVPMPRTVSPVTAAINSPPDHLNNSGEL